MHAKDNKTQEQVFFRRVTTQMDTISLHFHDRVREGHTKKRARQWIEYLI